MSGPIKVERFSRKRCRKRKLRIRNDGKNKFLITKSFNLKKDTGYSIHFGEFNIIICN